MLGTDGGTVAWDIRLGSLLASTRVDETVRKSVNKSNLCCHKFVKITVFYTTTQQPINKNVSMRVA